ncbi:MAG: bifunctional 3-deoxy-7-phosphoheptulonate synthase/chorismate mutase [Phototrophicaceae bacterium]|jgi:3-deoxy-7-phosphoheptulonate synthase/chorismate mutase
MTDHSTQLQTLRGQIDQINLQLLELLNQRAEVAAQIGKVQSAMGSGFYDPEREGNMLNTLQLNNKGPFSNETIKGLFREIFRASLELEETQDRQRYLFQKRDANHHTVIELANGAVIGDGSFITVTGPCAVESVEQMEAAAEALNARGIKIIRGMAFKPRTSPYDFQGLGEEGLQIARTVADKYNMAVTSEIMDLSQIDMMSQYVDLFWVGARNMQNSFLLKALGKVKQPVFLKRSFGANYEEWLYAAEYIISSGNPNVILIERGIRTYEKWTRNTLDISAVPAVKSVSHLPIIVDVSHSAGRRDLALPLAKAAKAVGADGLMVEVHPNPAVAMSDAKQQLNFAQFNELMDALEAM